MRSNGAQATSRPTREGGVPPVASPRVWVPVALLILHVVLLRSAPAIPAHRWLFVVFFLTVVLLPGYLLSTIIARRANPPVRALLSLVCGTAVTYGLLTLFAILHWKLRHMGIAAPLVSAALVAIRYRRDRLGTRAVREPTHLDRAVPGSAALVLVAVLVAACILVAYAGAPLPYTSDSPDHIAYIRTISRTGYAFPDRFLYPDGGILTRDIRKGLVHAMWGTLNILTGRTDSLAVWPLVSMIGSAFMLLALFCAGSILMGSAAAGLIAAILFLLIYNEGLAHYQLVTLAYAFPFGKIFYIALLAFAIRYFTSGKRIYLSLSVLASVAATGTHINHFLLTAFIMTVFSAVALGAASPDRRRRLAGAVILPAGLGIILANLPYLLLRYIRDYAPNNEIHSHVQGIFYITDTLYVVNPLVFYQLGGPLFLLSAVSAVVLWNRSRRNEPVTYLRWSVIAVVALVFNPILVPLLMERISYLLLRFEFAVPSALLPAFLVRTLWSRARGRERIFSRRRTVVGWIAVLIFAVYPILGIARGFAYTPEKVRTARRDGFRSLFDLYEAINARLPAGSVIASDPLTSYSIPAFTDQFVACTLDQHSIPNDSTALERILDHRDIVTPGTGLAEILRTLDRYQETYLLINGRIPPTVPVAFWKPDSANARRTIERLYGRPAYFNPLYRTETASLFAVTDAPRSGIREDEEPVPRYIGPVIAPEDTAALTPSGVESIHIRDVAVGRRSVRRGEKLAVTIEWVSSRPSAPGSYSAFVRFDSDYEKGPLYRDWYGKLYRKLYEAVHGERHRFTATHAPLGGIYPPDRWRPFRVIRDRWTITVPPDLSPGLYRVGVKLMVTTQYPNYTIRDFLSDRDSMAGTIMTEVNVE
jgi:hypothetical protein